MLNLIVGHDAAYLMTDSGVYGDAGEVIDLVPKTLFATGNCVIGATGACVLQPVVNSMLERFDAADFTLREFRDRVFTHYEMHGLDPVGRAVRVAAAGFDKGRPFGLTFTSSPADCAPGEEPWMWYETGVLLSPAVEPVWSDGEFDPDRHAVALAEQQRAPRSDWWADFGGPRSCVAGTITLSGVSTAGVHSVSLVEYPDRIGELAGFAAECD